VTIKSFKRLISYNGLLKETHKVLFLEVERDGILIHIDDTDEIANGVIDVMDFGMNNYIFQK